MPAGWVCITSDRPNGILYVGVTNDVRRRVTEHKERLIRSFTLHHELKLLIYAERHENMVSATQREKNVKHWARAWNVRLVGQQNRDWNDLMEFLPF